MSYTQAVREYMMARPKTTLGIPELRKAVVGRILDDNQVRMAIYRIRSEDNVRFQIIERGRAWRYEPNAMPEDASGKVTVPIKDDKPAAHRVREMREEDPLGISAAVGRVKRKRYGPRKMPNTVRGQEVPSNTPPDFSQDQGLAEVTERTTFKYMGFSDVNGALLLKASNGKAYVAREL